MRPLCQPGFSIVFYVDMMCLILITLKNMKIQSKNKKHQWIFANFSSYSSCKTRNFQIFLLGATETIQACSKRHFQGFFLNFKVNYYLFWLFDIFKLMEIFFHFGALWNNFFDRQTDFFIAIIAIINDFSSNNLLPAHGMKCSGRHFNFDTFIFSSLALILFWALGTILCYHLKRIFKAKKNHVWSVRLSGTFLWSSS